MVRFLSPLFGYVQKFHTFARNHLATDALKLVRSVFLGQKRVLEETDQTLLKQLGIFHLFVVSGFHVSIIVLFLHWQFHRWGWLGRILTLAGIVDLRGPGWSGTPHSPSRDHDDPFLSTSRLWSVPAVSQHPRSLSLDFVGCISGRSFFFGISVFLLVPLRDRTFCSSL